MDSQEIQTLIDHKSSGCVTIVQPLYRTSPGRQQNDLLLRKSFEKVKQLMKLKTKGDGYDNEETIHRMEELYHSIDLVHCSDGVGIYVSPLLARMVNFPFHVEEEVNYADHFSTLALYRLLFANRSYLLLSLRQDSVHLYKGEGKELSEVLNHQFPLFYQETYEYGKPEHISHHGSTVSKEVEKDKNQLQLMRVKAFYRTVDVGLKDYLDHADRLLIAGTKKERHAFKEVTEYTKRINGEVDGNYIFASIHTLGDKAWQIIQESLALEEAQIVSELNETTGKGLSVFGLESVWSHVREKRGFELYIDPHFPFKAFVSNDRSSLFTHKSTMDKTLKPFPRILDYLIERHLSSDGVVRFMDGNRLDEFGGIALTLRY